MAKTLKDFKGGFKPNSEAEANFIDKHVVIRHPDRNGNGDDVFKATNIKYVNRAAEGHGYDTEADAAVYESVEDLDLTEAESKGRKAAEFKPKQVQGLYHYNHYEHPDGSWFQAHVSNGTRKTKQFVVKKAGEKQHTTYNNVADVKKHLGINESYTEPQNLKFHDQVDAYHKKVGGTRKGNSIHYKPGEGDFGAVASNHMSRHGWHPTRNPGEKVHKHGHTMTTKNEKKKDGWHTTLTFHEKQNESVELDENTEKKYWVTHNAIGEKSKKLVGHTKPFKSLNDAKEHINNMIRKGDRSAKRIHVSGKDGYITHNFNYDGHNMSYRNPTGAGDASMEKHLIKESVELEETYTIKSLGHEKTAVIKSGKVVKTFHGPSAPADARLHLSKLVKEGYEEDLKDFETNADKHQKHHNTQSDYHFKKAKEHSDAATLNGTFKDARHLAKAAAHRKACNAHSDAAGAIVMRHHSAFYKSKEANKLSSSLNEEAESLDELSKKTLGSYVKKATAQAAVAGHHEGESKAKMDVASNIRHGNIFRSSEDSDKHFDNMVAANKQKNKRYKGVVKATDKLTKEDFNYDKDSVIDSVLEKFIEPKLTPLTLEEKLVRNLSDLPESSSKLVLDLFNTLDEENQKHLVRLSEDADEHVGLVDFALDNKDLI